MAPESEHMFMFGELCPGTTLSKAVAPTGSYYNVQQPRQAPPLSMLAMSKEDTITNATEESPNISTRGANAPRSSAHITTHDPQTQERTIVSNIENEPIRIHETGLVLHHNLGHTTAQATESPEVRADAEHCSDYCVFMVDSSCHVAACS
jgi:hypothetical protein